MSATGSRAERTARFVASQWRERPGAVVAAGGLALLTLLAIVPIRPAGPLDARTGERLAAGCGARMEFSAAGALVEPLAAPGLVIFGAPDWRKAGASLLTWTALAGAALVLVFELRRRPRPPSGAHGEGADRRRSAWRTAAKAILTGLAAGVVLIVHVAFAAIAHLPGWRLVATDEDTLVCDLQTHTFGSHDGIISARDNLILHAARGCDVVAVTEHDDPRGSFEAAKLADFYRRGMPVVIPGVELRDPGAGFLLAIGLDETLEVPWFRDSPRRVEIFVRGVHEAHGGAVVALGWKLDADGVRRYVEAGVDGFEVANAGHPDLRDDARRAMLEAHAAEGTALLSSSDWHGWGGFWRTWTLVRAPGARRLPRSERARLVTAALRERGARGGPSLVPVVAGRLGLPSTPRVVFAPFVETARYAMELGPLRVLAWWLWAAAVVAAAEGLRRLTACGSSEAGGRFVGFRPSLALLAALLAVLGVGLVTASWHVIDGWADWAAAVPRIEGRSGEPGLVFSFFGDAFPLRWARRGLALGLATFATALLVTGLELRRTHLADRAGPPDTCGPGPDA